MRPPDAGRPSLLTRRGFLAASAGLVVAAACGDDDSTDTSGDDGNEEALGIVRLFADELAVEGVRVRLPLGLAGRDEVTATDVPPRMDVAISGQGVKAPATVERHKDGIPRPYFPLDATFTGSGLYEVTLTSPDVTAKGTLQVVEATEPHVPRPGEAMIPFATPTPDDHRGVNPICTRKPACPLHDVTLEQALGEGKPVAFLISTPAYCQTQICGPVLDLLLGERDAYADRVRMLHADVYTDDQVKTLAPVLNAYHLTWEPSLFLARADGTITARLDNIFDRKELRAELDKLV